MPAITPGAERRSSLTGIYYMVEGCLDHMLPSLCFPGAGDRLGLQCEATGQCLPAAMLPYCGRTMMEGLLRDLQAREAMYYRLTGKQVRATVRCHAQGM